MKALSPSNMSSRSFQILSNQKCDTSLEKLVRGSALSSNEVIELLASHDTLTKKLTCHYLVERSVKDSELSLLTANLLLRDSNDANPAVRSSSLLALSTLHGLEEPAISAVTKAMSDSSPQVRRVSPICCINLHNLTPSYFLESGLVNLLYEGIRDSDPIVITNCLLALEKVLCKEGSLVINRNIANYLVQKIPQFSDCNLVYVLNILTKYHPKSEDDIFNIINELDSCFTSSVPSVLLASVQLFLHLINGYPHLKHDLLEMIKIPVCKILSQNIHEVSYLMLDYLGTNKLDLNTYFGDSYKVFLLRTKDPSYLKRKKLEVLPLVVTVNNVKEIISEIQHYSSDFQSFKAAFQCLGLIGLFDEEATLSVFHIISTAVRNRNEQVVVAALECFLAVSLSNSRTAESNNTLHTFSAAQKNICPSIREALALPILQENYPILALRIFQSIAPFLDNVSSLLEDYAKQMDLWDLTARCLFVTTAAVIFLHYPAQTQSILTTVLSKALSAPEQQLNNHAAFIYAVLEEGPTEAKKLLSVSANLTVKI